MQSLTNIRFKNYTQQQLSLIPPSWEKLIEENHPVRVINQVIDRLDLQPLIKKEKLHRTFIRINYIIMNKKISLFAQWNKECIKSALKKQQMKEVLHRKYIYINHKIVKVVL